MITLQDCVAFCDAKPATVARLARQQHLPELLAIACAHSRTASASRTFARRLPNHRQAESQTLPRAA